MAKRLFIALELPADCCDVMAAVTEPIPGLRWVPADQPHLTLARLKNVPAHKLRSFLKANRSREFGSAAIESFTLFSSMLGPVGAVHHVEERYALVAG